MNIPTDRYWRKVNKHWLKSIVLAAILAAGGYALWNQGFVPPFEKAIEVEVVAAKKISTPAVIQAVGQLQAKKETNVISVVPGVVKEIRKVGDTVKTGEVVVVIESKPLTERLRKNEAAVKAAAAALQEVKRRLEGSEKKLAIVREAYAKELIARRDLEATEAAAETVRAENERAQAQIAQSEAALAQTRYLIALARVVAPASGIVTGRTAEPGASVAASATIMSLADPVMMRVVIQLPTAEARLVHPGVAVTVRVPALREKVFAGSVSHVKIAAEGEGNASTAEVELRNSDGTLKPALPALISVPLERERVVVPYAAGFELQGQPCVYVIEDQRAKLRSITTGAQESGDIVVTSNLAEGEKVVVAGQSKLLQRRHIRIIE